MTLLPLGRCRKRLALLWLGSSGFLIALLMLQSLLGRWGADVPRAWDWLLPSVLPTMMLIVGVLVVELRAGKAQDETVDPFLYRLAASLSLFHLGAVGLTLVMAAVRDDLGLLQTSRLWLAATQGLASAALGAFFVSRKD
jgi:hypothetical protein